ncbi:ATP-dependent DNA helicase [Demequina activiva]|uniref:DNA 3'-5' helicase n=1 Tax=Demequina activiva TaxID=1582364 RepID=A0A919Q701_9MICO|nr:ATP-dependent DNA helicase [Demequina activiva]GIG55353.1 ATP-dependent DNA helicase [Demequina activiva]
MTEPIESGHVDGYSRTVPELAAIISPDTSPTPEQSAIIGAGLEPTLIVAGAGSGKTETLSMRMVYLLDHGERLFGRPISPDEILCLTFTRKAAAEIAERAAARITSVFGADPARPPVSVATYNGYAASLVAEHGLRLGTDPDAATLTDAALWQIADAVVSQWSDPVDTAASVSTLTRAVSSFAAQTREHLTTPFEVRDWARGTLDGLAALPGARGGTALVNANGNPTPEANALKQLTTLIDLAPMAHEFLRRKREGSYLDFSDQVAYGVALADLDTVQAIERSRYRVVLLDEFQDTSPAQLRLFARMFGADHPVMAVGDPNQAIYGFRGASASALSAFVEQFGGAEHVSRRSLSVSWRNEAAVLAAANMVASALPEQGAVRVEPLRSTGQYLGRPEPRRAAPGVVAHMAQDLSDEADAVAAFIVARRREIGRSGVQPTAAVLCRRRSQFGSIVEALAKAGLDYEVVGLGGLIDTPEVAELIALLQVAHDPSRGDSLMRLLAGERIALGPRDLMALKDWSDHDADRSPGADRSVPGLREHARTIVDGLDSLPGPAWVSREGRSFTPEGLARLATLREVVRAIRQHTYLSLTETIAFAERAWCLDIEAEVSRPDGRASRNVDAFLDAARTFAAGAERATLGAFLAWLDAARDEERGLTAPVKEPEPGAVQVLTCHSAKGLEWDIVAVPGLTQGASTRGRSQFPSGAVPTVVSEDGRRRIMVKDSGWMSEAGQLPYPLRLDRDDLPPLDLGDVVDRASLKEAIEDFKAEAGAHRVDEERRLFYVALTRARSHVLLSGSWWTAAASRSAPSLFLAELRDAGVVDDTSWAPEPAEDAERPVREPAMALWPGPPSAEQATRRDLAARVREALDAREQPATAWEDLPFGRDIEAMLAERARRGGPAAAVPMPGHLTASHLVAMRRDRDAFARQLRRPVPQEPTLASARGTAMHAWIEAHYGHPTLWEPDAMLADDGDDGDDIAALRATFEASEWAGRQPSDIEVKVEMPLGGVTIRSRIDAVFPPGQGLDKVTVVDWKSGAPPPDADERAAREVQLAIYRLAWSAWKGIPLEEVDAAFYYVGADTTVWPERLLERDEIVALLRGE